MIAKQVTTPSSALPGRPERPFIYVCPVTAPDGSIGYDRPLENYFDASMAPRLLPTEPTTSLYDTVARAHDYRYEVTQDMVDPSWPTPRPLILNPRERHRSLANVPADVTEHLGISPDVPGWHPHRSADEDRRGAVGVAPSEINSLIQVPYIPPIDTRLPSRKWLDEEAKRILADAHAESEDTRHNTSNTTTVVTAGPDDDTAFFDYDTDGTLDYPTTHSRTLMPHPPPSSSHDASLNSITETDTDTDTDSNDGYDWNLPRSPPSGPGSQWLIPRKRPSVVIDDSKQASRNVRRKTQAPRSYCGRPRKRQGGKAGRPEKVSKMPTHENNTPVRRGRRTAVRRNEQGTSLPPAHSSPPTNDIGNLSYPPATTATVLQMQEVRPAAPGINSFRLLPPSHTPSSVHPRLFPCLLDGCDQVCASAGDLQRHQQCLRHSAPSFCCLACGASYTRPDALKRHLNCKPPCRKEHEHALKLSTKVEEIGAEAEAEEQVVATSSG